MRSAFDVWQRNLWKWAIPLGVCVLGLVGVAVYYSSFEGRVEVLERRQQRLTENLDAYREESREIAEFLERIELQRQGVRNLYGDHFQTEDSRFTKAILEVRRLARQAGLAPNSFSYPTQSEGGLVRRDINFSVNGTYRQLRAFINLLELSDQFLTLESITLSGDASRGNQEPTLSIGLRLTTYFASQPLPAEDAEATPEGEGTEAEDQGGDEGDGAEAAPTGDGGQST